VQIEAEGLVAIVLRWPWERSAERAEAAAAEAAALRDECKALHAKALQCALAAGEAAGLARGGGVGDGAGGGLDPDLETLDTHRGRLA
jgi:hypothetical protein